MHSIALFGGTFDPVHNGHLETSQNIQNHFNFDTYLFLPCKSPTLKSPAQASNAQRLEMLHLALKKYPQFKVDVREIKRSTPSYMVETLKSFRQEYPDDAITLIIGYDAFLSLPQWYQWEELIKLANILVINRQEFAAHQPSPILQRFLNTYESKNKSDLLNKKAGAVLLFDAGNYEISSTVIRTELRKNKDLPRQIPEAVNNYIKAEGLYQ